jgi:hypothetical protein
MKKEEYRKREQSTLAVVNVNGDQHQGGIEDERSWVFWHSVPGIYPVQLL